MIKNENDDEMIESASRINGAGFRDNSFLGMEKVVFAGIFFTQLIILSDFAVKCIQEGVSLLIGIGTIMIFVGIIFDTYYYLSGRINIHALHLGMANLMPSFLVFSVTNKNPYYLFIIVPLIVLLMFFEKKLARKSCILFSLIEFIRVILILANFVYSSIAIKEEVIVFHGFLLMLAIAYLSTYLPCKNETW